MNQESTYLLDVHNLKVYFRNGDQLFRAVDGVSFHLPYDESLALVGKSGSGKTMMALAIVGLIHRPGVIISGEVRFENKNLLGTQPSEIAQIRGRDIVLVSQNSSSALCPVFRVESHFHSILKSRYPSLDKRARNHRASEFLRLVGFHNESEILSLYPFELSGGMAQRVHIAMALSCAPKLIILDEPTTGLDVVSQAHLLNVLCKIKEKFELSIIMITHDILVIHPLCEHIIVLRNGKVVEKGETRAVIKAPQSRHTKDILNAAHLFSLDNILTK
jgi:peptide/nickel transport system ATP-binding protein